MSLIHKILLNCKDATFLICKRQEASISFKENIQLSLHLLVCKVCAFFNKQTLFLHSYLKQINDENCEHHLLQLDDKQKTVLQEKINSEL